MLWDSWTNRAAREFICRLEPELRKVGYHTALTGSVLYGGGTGKDLDVVVFPHDASVPRDQRESALLAALIAAGLELYVDVDRMHANWRAKGGADIKRVRVYGYGDRRVDVMFLE